MGKEIPGFRIESLRVPAKREFLHSVQDAILSTKVFDETEPEAYKRWKMAFDEMNRVYEISLKSEDTALIFNLDERRDNLMAGIRSISNNFRKAMDDETRTKGTAVWDAINSFRVNIEAQYNIQTAQLDSLLGVLLGDQLKPIVEALGMLPIVQELKSLNDRLHELVGIRDLENIGKPDGQRQAAIDAAIAAYRNLVKYVNAYYLINVETAGNTDNKLALFIDLVSSIIARYRRNFPNASGNSNSNGGTTDSEVGDGEDTDGDSNDGAGEDDGEGDNGLGGEPSNPGSDSNEGSNEGSTEEEEEREAYTIAWYNQHGNPIKTAEVLEGDPVPAAPEPPSGYTWPSYPTVMPGHDVDVMPVAV